MVGKKILFINRALNGGGSERVMSIIASYFAEQGIRTEMVLVDDEKKVYPVSDKIKIVEMKLPLKGNKIIWQCKWFLKMRKIIKDSDADTIVSFLWDMNMKVTLASLGLGKRLVLSERADPQNGNRRKSFGFACKYIFPLADQHVFQTTDVQKFFSKKIQERSCVIANPIDTNHLEVYRGERDYRIVAVGRLTLQKNFEMLIDAFASFYKNHPEYTLEIYGDGVLKEKLTNQIIRNGLTGQVALKGYVSDLQAQICSAAIYVSSSNFEGISNSMLEAMGLGIPSICTDCPVGGARMVIESGINGILIPVNDKQALVNALEELANNPDKAKLLSNNAEKVREKYSIGTIGNKWVEVCFPEEN